MKKSIIWLLLFILTACSGGPSGQASTQVAGVQTQPTSIVLQPSPAPTYTAPMPAQPAAAQSTAIPVAVSTEDPFPDDPPYYYGGLVMTMEEVGTTLTMRPSGSFMLALGSDYIWTVTVEPATLLTANRKVTPELGEQGVFVARQRGKGVLRAVGEPVCRRLEPACTRPDVLYTLHILVE